MQIDVPAQVSEFLPQEYRCSLHLNYVISMSLWYAFAGIPRQKYVKYYKNKNLGLTPTTEVFKPNPQSMALMTYFIGLIRT